MLLLFGEKLSQSLKTKTQFYGSFNKKYQKNLNTLRDIAVQHRLRILTANQIGLGESVLVYLPQNSKMVQSNYEICFNPTITKISNETITYQESSPSFPQFQAQVTRHKVIKVQYDNLSSTTIKEELSGNEAIWFQQGLDQLMGNHLLTWPISRGTVQIKPKYLEKAQQNQNFIDALNKLNEGGKQYTKERGLKELNLQDLWENYALSGPTHEIDQQDLYDKLLTNLENELFYTFFESINE